MSVAEKPRIRARLSDLRIRTVRSPAVGIFLWSRAAIWAGALFAWLVFEPNHHPMVARWDDPALTRDLGWVTDVWARWDSVWFLRIAEDGYARTQEAAAAFYPLYPGLVAVLDPVFLGHTVLAGTIDELDELGLLVKDIDAGLVDFPAVIEGEPVLLCWRLGEDEVAWYHGYDDGFAGRRPL